MRKQGANVESSRVIKEVISILIALKKGTFFMTMGIIPQREKPIVASIFDPRFTTGRCCKAYRGLKSRRRHDRSETSTARPPSEKYYSPKRVIFVPVSMNFIGDIFSSKALFHR
jgi:hypothetical protein